jgi:hypothetical protein
VLSSEDAEIALALLWNIQPSVTFSRYYFSKVFVSVPMYSQQVLSAARTGPFPYTNSLGFSANLGLDRQRRSRSSKIQLNAVTETMMESYNANALQTDELTRILARPRIDFSSILGTVRIHV